MNVNNKLDELKVLLVEHNIPHENKRKFEDEGVWIVKYPNIENCVCSVIVDSEGQLEIMGLLERTDNTCDDVIDGLSVEEVFRRIQKHYSQENSK